MRLCISVHTLIIRRSCTLAAKPRVQISRIHLKDDDAWGVSHCCSHVDDWKQTAVAVKLWTTRTSKRAFSTTAAAETTTTISSRSCAQDDDEEERRSLAVRGNAIAVRSSLLSAVDEPSSSSTNFNQSLIPYHRSWAWQSWLLHQRLRSRRRESIMATTSAETYRPDLANTATNSLLQPLPFLHQSKHNHHGGSDQDVILLLEHDHVYTLGRGADENHLTFLKDHPNETVLRQRLARTNRGPGSARLSVDPTILQRFDMEEENSARKDPTINGNWIPSDATNTSVPEQHLAQQAVNALSSWATNSCVPVLAPNGVPIYRVERGGQVTYHGPGQLVVYPLLDLKQRRQLRDDLHWFLHVMEEVIIQTCHQFGIRDACRRDDVNTGVWVDDCKVAAVGVAASRWITTHGFALNVDPDLSYFDTSIILPCGIEGKGVTSIAKLLRERQEQQLLPGQQHQHQAEKLVSTTTKTTEPTIHEVAAVVLEQIQNVLEIELESPQRLEPEIQRTQF